MQLNMFHMERRSKNTLIIIIIIIIIIITITITPCNGVGVKKLHSSFSHPSVLKCKC